MIKVNNKTNVEKETTTIKTDNKALTFPTELQEKFKNIDNKYSVTLTTWKNKQDDFTLTNDEASQLANEELNEYHSSQLEKINDQYKTQEDRLQNNYTKTQESYYKKLNQSKENYNQDKEDLTFDSIDKGWRTSSIYDNSLQQIEQEYKKEVSQINKEQSEKLNNLNFQKTLLEQEKENALQNFDISYAQKLSQKIEQITKEFNEVNKSSKQEADTKVNNILLDIGRDKTAEVLKYLSKYNKEDSLKFLNDNPNLKNELGQAWYNALSSWINNRK